MEQEQTRTDSRVGLRVFVEPDYKSAVITFDELSPEDEARLIVRVLASGEPVKGFPLPPGNRLYIDLHEIPHDDGLELALQFRTGDDWVDSPGHTAHLPGYGGEIATITPAEWGVEQDCWATIQDTQSRKVLLRRKISAGSTGRWARRPGAGSRYTLQFHEVLSKNDASGPLIGNTHRWVPPELRGNLSASPRKDDDGLIYTVRNNVVLAPGVRGRHGKGSHVTTGYIGAWENKQPIPEALLSVLGRQYSDFLPYVSPVGSVSTPVIYLGSPQSGWGHFLTQGLARIWYALANPHIPVVWDAHSLSSFQQEVLDILRLKNEQIFLRSPMRFSEVVFPQPGICIGDYVDPAFAARLGRHHGKATVAGRKILLSRSMLGAQTASSHASPDPLDELATDFGFEIVHPEILSVQEQLDLLSSAEVVLGVEGSAMHTPLLLGGDLRTRFFALTRHRAGSGVFEHMRKAKGLRYSTLNFKRKTGLSGFRGELELDYEVMRTAFEATLGLEANYDSLAPYRERPSSHETSFSLLAPNFQCLMSSQEDALRRLHLSLLAGKTGSAMTRIAAML